MLVRLFWERPIREEHEIPFHKLWKKKWLFDDNYLISYLESHCFLAYASMIDHFMRTSLIVALPKRVGGFADWWVPTLMKMNGPCVYEDLDFATCIKSSYSLNKRIRGPNIKKMGQVITNTWLLSLYSVTRIKSSYSFFFFFWVGGKKVAQKLFGNW